MRIGIVELYYGESGKKGFYNNQELGVAKAFKAKGYEIIVFYPQNDIDNIIEELVEDRIKIVYVPATTIGNHSKYDWNILKKYYVDIVQIGSDNQMFAPCLIRFCDKNKIPLYNYIGTIKSDTNSVIKAFIMKLLFLRNSFAYRNHKCFAKTTFVKKELEKYGIKNVEVANVGLDTTIIPSVMDDGHSIRSKLSIPNNVNVILFVGRMEEYKSPFEAIKLLSRLPDSFLLIMIGTGSLDSKVDNIINNSNLENRIIRKKKISNNDIHQYYKVADYFINFNKKEIFGMSILEAMYQGCSVIAFHAPGPDEIISNNIDGFLVNTIDEMRSIIVEEKKVEKKVARQKVVELFTWDCAVDLFNSWIESKN